MNIYNYNKKSYLSDNYEALSGSISASLELVVGDFTPPLCDRHHYRFVMTRRSLA
jgi:hypothetical protein